MAKALPRDMKPLDLMLLREMAMDATQTTTDLARKLGRSRSTVQWRLQELLDQKMIKIVPVHNPVAAGYKMGVLIGLKVLPNRVNAVAAEMASVPEVHNVIICAGRYDIILGAVFADTDKLSGFLTNELSAVSGVTSIETMVALKMVKASFTFMTPQELPSTDMPPVPGIDALDLLIIRELQNDPQQPQSDIAKKLGAGATTVRRRLKRLLDEHIIRIVAIADPHALGYHVRAMIGIKAFPGKTDAVADKLASYANVHYALMTTGPYDLVAWAVFRDTDELSSFLRHEIGSIKWLASYESMLTLKVAKDLLSSPTRNL
jgi:Lrp/AsnC family transcriptional regulator for asnA, asnC and gidA